MGTGSGGLLDELHSGTVCGHLRPIRLLYARDLDNRNINWFTENQLASGEVRRAATTELCTRCNHAFDMGRYRACFKEDVVGSAPKFAVYLSHTISTGTLY